MVIGGQNFNSTSRGHDHVSQVFLPYGQMPNEIFSSELAGGGDWRHKLLHSPASISNTSVNLSLPSLLQISNVEIFVDLPNVERDMLSCNVNSTN